MSGEVKKQLKNLENELKRYVEAGKFGLAASTRSKIRSLCKEHGLEEPDVFHDPGEHGLKKALAAEEKKPEVQTAVPVEKPKMVALPMANPKALCTRCNMEHLPGEHPCHPVETLATTDPEKAVAVKNVPQIDFQAVAFQAQEAAKDLAAQLSTSRQACQVASARVLDLEGELTAARAHGDDLAERCRELEGRLADALNANTDLLRQGDTDQIRRMAADALQDHGAAIEFVGSIACCQELTPGMQYGLGRTLEIMGQSMNAVGSAFAGAHQ